MLPTDLSLWHLHTTWLYWVLLAALVIELAWMAPPTMRALMAPRSTPAAGPWGSSAQPSPLLTISYVLSLLSALLTVLCLVLLSTGAFYAAALGVVPRLLRFASQIPHAKGGEQVGSVIGELIGGLLQIALILGAIASLDPTSEFPFRLEDHLTHDS